MDDSEDDADESNKQKYASTETTREKGTTPGVEKYREREHAAARKTSELEAVDKQAEEMVKMWSSGKTLH